MPCVSDFLLAPSLVQARPLSLGGEALARSLVRDPFLDTRGWTCQWHAGGPFKLIENSYGDLHVQGVLKLHTSMLSPMAFASLCDVILFKDFYIGSLYLNNQKVNLAVVGLGSYPNLYS
eukprot:scaffold56724_cov18-Tisochrysis_lutea.AAC.1